MYKIAFTFFFAEVIDGVSDGKFVEDKGLMCFLACMLELTNVVSVIF